MVQFIAIIRDISFGDAEGVGHKSRDKARTFEAHTTISEIWNWYQGEAKYGGGTLVLVPNEADGKEE